MPATATAVAPPPHVVRRGSGTPRFPRATYAVVDEAGHNLEIDQPDLVHAHLARWAQQMAEHAASHPAQQHEGDRPEHP